MSMGLARESQAEHEILPWKWLLCPSECRGFVSKFFRVVPITLQNRECGRLNASDHKEPDRPENWKVTYSGQGASHKRVNYSNPRLRHTQERSVLAK